MASTLTRSCMRISRVSGLTGATPTPQLPMMTVVTPCHGEHVTSGSQGICAAEVVGGVGVREAGSEDEAVGVDDPLRGLAVTRAHVPDHAALNPERAHEAGGAGSIADARVLDHEVHHGRSPFFGTVPGRRYGGDPARARPAGQTARRTRRPPREGGRAGERPRPA